VPIALLLTNCHFLAIFVPLSIGALLVGAVWERDGRNGIRYAWMLLLTCIACAMTPMLPGAIRAMTQYQSSDPMLGSGIIAELRPVWTSPVTTALVLVWLALAIRNRQKLRAGEWLWMLGLLAAYLKLARMAPALAPMAAATLAVGLPRFEGRVLAARPIRIAIASILVLGIVRLAMAFPGSNQPLGNWLNRHGPDTPGYPTAAAEFVADHVQPASGHLINEFSWGGYLAWKLGDKYQVLLDGRTQLYTPQFWNKTYIDRPDSARDILTSARADAAILPAERSRFRSTLIGMGWRSAYRDDRAEVLLPPETALGRAE
jgi:hypothetical protein